MTKRVKKVKNIWPFGPGQLLGSRSYHYKITGKGKRTKVQKSTTKSFKGYRIYKDLNGNYTIPQLTGNDGTYFEDLKEAKRFITDNVRFYRPRLKKNPGQGMKHTVITISNPAEWFKRCVEGVKAKGGSYDPQAVCATVMRKKKANARH